jgi:twitching motility two-component system response regulator PilH
VIASALQKRGYIVDIALNGQDGLSKVMAFHPHCLIVDVLMPGISGYTVCRYVREHFQQNMPHIILISTKDSPLDRYYGLRQGADRYLSKPFTEETLLQAVWEGLPTFLRQVAAPQLSATSPSRPSMWEFIPHRVPNTEAMRTSSPFTRSVVAGDERVRQFYMAIDGKKTVKELTAITGLETKEVVMVLRVLLQEHDIELYDSAGQFVESAFDPSWVNKGISSLEDQRKELDFS